MNDEDLEEMDEEAISAICLDLGAEVIHNILEAQTTKQIRRFPHEKESDEQVVCEEANLNLQMKDDSYLLEYPNVFNMLNTQLSNFGVKREEKDN